MFKEYGFDNFVILVLYGMDINICLLKFWFDINLSYLYFKYFCLLFFFVKKL